MSGTPPRVSEEAGREKRYCAVVPRSIRGSGQSEERGGSQVYTTGIARVYTFPKMSGQTGVEAGRRRYRRQNSKGLLPRSPGRSVTDSSQAARENAKERGEREGGGGLGRHSSSCNFRICVHICVPSSEKEKSPPNHITPLPLSVSHKFQDPEKKKNKKTQSASSSFWGREGWAIVVSVSSEAGGREWADWQGQPEDAKTSGLAVVAPSQV